MHIVVKDKDPKQSKNLNALAAEFAIFYQINKEQMEDSAEYLKHQIQVEKENRKSDRRTQKLHSSTAERRRTAKRHKAKLELITDFKTDRSTA